MSDDFWRVAVPELYKLREENTALRAEVERLREALSIYASPTSWVCEAELSLAGCPDRCIFWYRGERGHGYEIAKAAIVAKEE